MKLNLLLLAGVFAVATQSTAWAHDPVSHGDVKIDNAWVRATVAGQKATGAFMTITSKNDYTLVAGSSPAAGVVEIHEMKMDGDVMKMRALKDGLALPAGEAVELKPGGYHVMLMDLKQELPKDSKVDVSLTFKDKDGKDHTAKVSVPVAAGPQGAKTPDGHEHHHHDHGKGQKH